MQENNEEVTTLCSDAGNATIIEKVKVLNNFFKKLLRINNINNSNVTVIVDLNTTSSPIKRTLSIDNGITAFMSQKLSSLSKVQETKYSSITQQH